MTAVLIGLNYSGDVVFQRIDRVVQLQSLITTTAIGMCSRREAFWGPNTSYWITADVLSDPQDKLIWELAWAPKSLPHECERLRDHGKAGGSLVTEVGSFTLPDADGMRALSAVCDKIIECYPTRTRPNDRFSVLLERIPELALLEQCVDTNKITEARGMLRDILNSAS